MSLVLSSEIPTVAASSLTRRGSHPMTRQAKLVSELEKDEKQELLEDLRKGNGAEA